MEWHEPSIFPPVSSCLYMESVWFSSPFQSLCFVLSSGIKHNASASGRLLSSPTLADSQIWVSSTTRGRRLTFGTAPSHHSMGMNAVDRVTWELIRGLGYSGSSLPSWLGLSPANLLYREDFSQSAYMDRRYFGSVQGSQFCCWRLEGVRFWKFSRTYSGVKPPSLFLPKQGWCLATLKSTMHLLAIPTIPVGIRALYVGPMASSVSPA